MIIRNRIARNTQGIRPCRQRHAGAAGFGANNPDVHPDRRAASQAETSQVTASNTTAAKNGTPAGHAAGWIAAPSPRRAAFAGETLDSNPSTTAEIVLSSATA